MRLFILLMLAIPCFSQAQKLNNDSLAIILTQRHKKVNATKMTMPGYRIQIYFGNERINAQDKKSSFLQNHPKIAAYMVYHQPNFKVRVGDFRTRLEAVGFLKKIESDFKTSFIVPDDVKLPDL